MKPNTEIDIFLDLIECVEFEHPDSLILKKNIYSLIEERFNISILDEALDTDNKNICPKYKHKVRYRSEYKATNALKNFKRKKGDYTMKVYSCEYCGGWHIGHKISKERKEYLDKFIKGERK